MFSKRFKTIIGLSILLNLLHGGEVSYTKFYQIHPDFYFYTKYFSDIPEAVYYVQHGFLYFTLFIIFCFILGGRRVLIPLLFLGILLVSEIHHVIRSIMSLSYQSGAITSFLFIPMAYFFIKELILYWKRSN